MYMRGDADHRRPRAAAGAFEDAERMEHFVAAFAGRYLRSLEAWAARRHRRSDRGGWRSRPPRRWRPVILQHLLLGMNAHINLDLGVTAAEHAVDGALDAVRADFDAVNDVLAALVDECQGALGDVSPWLGLADRIGGGGDETMIRFSLDRRAAPGLVGRHPPGAARSGRSGGGGDRRRRRRGPHRDPRRPPWRGGEHRCCCSSGRASEPAPAEVMRRLAAVHVP